MKEFKKYINAKPKENQKPNTERKVKVRMFYGKDFRVRGFYQVVIDMDIENSDGFKSETYELFDGTMSKLVMPVARYSDKQFDTALQIAHGMESEMVEALCNKRKIELA